MSRLLATDSIIAPIDIAHVVFNTVQPGALEDWYANVYTDTLLVVS